MQLSQVNHALAAMHCQCVSSRRFCRSQSFRSSLLVSRHSAKQTAQPLWSHSFDCNNTRSSRRTFLGVCNSGLYGSDTTTDPECYITLGISQCFEKAEGGTLTPRLIIEPVTPSALECMVQGGATSFTHVFGTTVKEALTKDKSVLPEEFADGLWCEDFDFRVTCVARTWLRNHAQDNLLDIVPLGQVRGSFNFNLDYKRVLNLENVVNDDDNIKQDISIDVYGRKTKEEAQASAAAAEAAKAAEPKQEEEDELESLLAG